MSLIATFTYVLVRANLIPPGSDGREEWSNPTHQLMIRWKPKDNASKIKAANSSFQWNWGGDIADFTDKLKSAWLPLEKKLTQKMQEAG